MLINADFSRRAIVAHEHYQWVASPQGGVERVMLDRIGQEQARATSIVRYAPESYFPAHHHPGGEEVLVLSGVFSEGQTHYPEGWYLRSPPGSSHQPASAEGAVIFVKLCQMPPHERSRVRINTRDPAAWRNENGREICPLFSAGYEQVCLQRLPARALLLAQPVNGAEVLVLEGEVAVRGQSYGRGSWLRLPPGETTDVAGAPQGATVYLKTGHLGYANP
ncbi:cupin domain-containing protein [Bordetella sp. FB-8]|uniref:cupin domain-containing protein n=1 Tax=Bordetella sp. FB-8 TaxID=1159870 RepID=UPI0003642E45|nr:cupin domain-containing protein [Bordetella sp. FB-8]